jgi:nicotinamide mononucleotide transporter
LSWDTVGFNVLGQHVPLVELAGNASSLSSVWLAIRGSAWCWPAQLAGNVGMFAVYLHAGLGGNAIRQVAFASLAVYGITRWRHRADGGELVVRRASWATRAAIGLSLAGLTGVVIVFLAASGTSTQPVPDGAILAGSLAATVLQARALLEFWWCWLLVDGIGVPMCLRSALYVTGAVYITFGVLAVAGLRTWAAIRTSQLADATTSPSPSDGHRP